MQNHFQEKAKKLVKNVHSWFYMPMNSPVGELKLIASEKHLVAILWQGYQPRWMKSAKLERETSHPILLRAKKQLREYFDGKRSSFDLPLEFHGTSFQIKVWRELQRIPFGQTRSYRDLAVRIGSPKACRAVGAANGRNPLGIVVPCHRVIGMNGKLTGFAGGIQSKSFLLNLEGVSTHE